MKKSLLISSLMLSSLMFGYILCAQQDNVIQKAANAGDDPLWMSETPTIKPVQDGEFSLILFGDTQKTTQNAPQYLRQSFEWCVDNKDAYKIKYVCGLGDIVDDVDDEDTGRDNIGDDPETQLTNASNYYKLLKDAEMNFSLILGNHDYEDMAFFNRRMDAFSRYFTPEIYTTAKNGEGYQGSMNGTIENTYHYFQNGSDKYMIVSIGHHPNDEIIDWANQIIKANTDRKVILCTHGYISGGNIGKNYPYYEFDAGGYGERTPQGEMIFEKIVNENDNVEMVFCGHSLGDDNKRVVRSDTYNKFGHVVHQFMVNPADIDLPIGGCGLIQIMTFRNDGTVDVNYYSPGLNKYFNPESQFTFDFESNYIAPNENVTVIGRELTERVGEDYTVYNLKSDLFTNLAYSYRDVEISNAGLVPLNDDASITYKFNAKDGHRFQDVLASFDYNSTSRKGGVVLSTSIDGENYRIVNSFDGVSQSARKISSSTYASKLHLKYYLYDQKGFYVRLSFLKDSVNNISLNNFALNSIVAQTTMDNNGTFGIDLDFSKYQNYELMDWAKNTVYIHDILVMGGYLGTGRADDYAGARGQAVWHFEAPNGSKIDSLTFNAKGRLTLSQNSTFLPPYLLKVEYAVDDEDFDTFVSEPRSGKTSFDYDLTSVVKGATSVKIRLTLWGDSWNSVGLSNLSIKGGYSYGITYHVGEGTNNEFNPSSYGTSNKSIYLYDPTAPEYYEFAGWYDNENYEGEAMYDLPAGTYGKLDLYAKYEAVRRNITYHLNGGKNSSNNPSTFEVINGLTLEPATRNGYAFKGWYDNETFTGDQITTIAPKTDYDVDLYAKFLKNYRISYVTNGGKIADNEKIESFTIEDDFNLPIPTKDGYTFDGWYLEKTYETKIDKIPLGRDSALIVYAKWIKGTKKASGCGGSITVASTFITLLSLGGILLINNKKEK